MVSIYQLKPAFQGLLRPLTKILANNGVTANQVTVAAIILSVVGGLAVGFFQVLFVLPLVLFIRMALNAIDGMLAREHNMKTSLGAVLNELGDVLSDAALYLPLALHQSFSAILVVSIVLLSILSEMAGVVGVQIGASRRYDGPMGKSDRACLFGFLALLVEFGVPEGRWLNGVLLVAIPLLLYTIYNRCYQALRELNE